MENIWKQIEEFDPETYKDELLVCQIWLGLASPVFVTCKYNRIAKRFYVIVLKRLPDNGISLAIPKIAQAYKPADVKCWTYLTDLAVSTGEFKPES